MIYQVMDLSITKLLNMVPAMINTSMAVMRDTRQVFDQERIISICLNLFVIVFTWEIQGHYDYSRILNNYHQGSYTTKDYLQTPYGYGQQYGIY